jgi:hypothetical protein
MSAQSLRAIENMQRLNVEPFLRARSFGARLRLGGSLQTLGNFLTGLLKHGGRRRPEHTTGLSVAGEPAPKTQRVQTSPT